MSYRGSSPHMARDSGPSSSSSRSYNSGRGGYNDRHSQAGRGYRNDYEARGSRRSRSPPRSKEGYSHIDRRDDRYDGRRDRHYPREVPLPPRDERSSRHTGPPPPRHDVDSRRRQASPPRRAERDQRYDEERERERRQEPERPKVDDFRGDEAENGDAEDGEVQEDPEADMMAAMGFGGFGTTKNTKVDGNQTGAAEVKKERTWRQYMQRKGGFNRPLSPVRKS